MLNALFLDPGVSGGVETYLRGLAPALHAAAPHMRIAVATTRRGADALAADGWADWCRILRFRCDEGSRLARQYAEQVALPVTAGRAGYELVHSLASIGPVWTPRLAHVATLHDVSFFTESTFGLVTTHGMRTIMRGVSRDIDAALTGTAVARDEICDVLGLDPSFFVVAHHGFAPRLEAGDLDPAGVRERLSVGDSRLVLCVAAKRPHKNQELLVRAARLLPDDVRILLVGHAEAYAGDLERLIAEQDVADRVLLVDYLSDQDLGSLWSTAACAAFPTRAEGFGIPVVEAMDRGVPVACSDIPVLREVGGDVPRFFSPDDPVACAAAVREALNGDDRGAAGAARAAGFTWAASATATLEAYRRATSTAARGPRASSGG